MAVVRRLIGANGLLVTVTVEPCKHLLCVFASCLSLHPFTARGLLVFTVYVFLCSQQFIDVNEIFITAAVLTKGWRLS